jgi:hypothetical protein
MRGTGISGGIGIAVGALSIAVAGAYSQPANAQTRGDLPTGAVQVSETPAGKRTDLLKAGWHTCEDRKGILYYCPPGTSSWEILSNNTNGWSVIGNGNYNEPPPPPPPPPAPSSWEIFSNNTNGWGVVGNGDYVGSDANDLLFDLRGGIAWDTTTFTGPDDKLTIKYSSPQIQIGGQANFGSWFVIAEAALSVAPSGSSNDVFTGGVSFPET